MIPMRPTAMMPMDAANWLENEELQQLSGDERCEIMDALCIAWEKRELSPGDWSQAVWEQFTVLLWQMLDEGHRTEINRLMRWNQ